MRPVAKREWEEQRKGMLRRLADEQKAQDEDWKRIVKEKAYFGSAQWHVFDALSLFALEERDLAEAELEFALRCLEKAEEIDDCYWYGKMYDRVYEETFAGMPYIAYAYGAAADDSAEPWHDEELGRALRVRMLFTCRWLKNGEREEALLERMIGHLRNWLDFQFGLPKDSSEARRSYNRPEMFLPEFVQWCVETGEFDLAKEYFRKHSGRRLPIPPVGWRFTKRAEDVLFLLAVHQSGERDLSQLFPEALDRCYRWTCRQIGRGEVGYLVDEDTLGLAYLRAQMLGLPTEPRELLRRIREDS